MEVLLPFPCARFIMLQRKIVLQRWSFYSQRLCYPHIISKIIVCFIIGGLNRLHLEPSLAKFRCTSGRAITFCDFHVLAEIMVIIK